MVVAVDDPSDVKVLSLNCWGIPIISKDYDLRIDEISKELAKGKFDIVGLQEIWAKDAYEKIRREVKTMLPYSHYFYSGVIGTGVCVFSRYPIIDAFLHQFPVNGNFYALMHGDWFGGKGIGFCLIQHPKQLIHFFAVHVHADYPSNDYQELRTLQTYHVSQFIHKITRPGDSVILCGDFNHEESETGVKMVKTLARLKDAWNSCIRKTSSCGNTIDCEDNPYKEKGCKTKRIDFIFHSSNFRCKECGPDMEQIPGKSAHFSDHKGVSAVLAIDGIEADDMVTQKTEDEAVLQEAHQILLKGAYVAESVHWQKVIVVFFLLTVFIFMPVLTSSGFYVVFPKFETLYGKMVFIVQIFCVLFSMGYFWLLIINRRIEKHAYKNALTELELKLKSDNK